MRITTAPRRHWRKAVVDCRNLSVSLANREGDQLRPGSRWPLWRDLWLNSDWFDGESLGPFSTVGKGSPIPANVSVEMETVLLRGGELATTLRGQIRLARMKLLRDGGRPPVLVTLAVDPNASADAYRTSISRTMKRVEIEHRPIDLPIGCQ